MHQMVIFIVKWQITGCLIFLGLVVAFLTISLETTIFVATILHYLIGEPSYKKLRSKWKYFSFEGKGSYTKYQAK